MNEEALEKWKKIGEITAELKRISRERGVPIIVTVQNHGPRAHRCGGATTPTLVNDLVLIDDFSGIIR